MSEKQEKRRRYNIKLAYAAALDAWLRREPPMILFWRWRKWLKERPVLDEWLIGDCENCDTRDI